MALEQVFVCPSTLKKLRSDPLGALLDGFCKWLLQKRFSRSRIRIHLSVLSHLNEHLGSPKAPMRQSVTAGGITADNYTVLRVKVPPYQLPESGT